MQSSAAMIITKRKVNRVLQGMLAAMPAIPYIMRPRRRTPIAAYVLGGVGFAIAGGVVALMLFSPRARHRALHAAKDTYGKVHDKIGLGHARAGDGPPMSNGLVDRGEQPTAGV